MDSWPANVTHCRGSGAGTDRHSTGCHHKWQPMDLDGCVRGHVAVAQPACQNHGAMVLTGTMVLRRATNISKLADASKSAVVMMLCRVGRSPSMVSERPWQSHILASQGPEATGVCRWSYASNQAKLTGSCNCPMAPA